MAASSTVRLVPETERQNTDDSESTKIGSPSPFYGTERGPAGDRFSLVSELVSSYFHDMENMHEYGADGKPRMHFCEDPRGMREDREESAPIERKPQLSWFLTLFLLTTVTVVCHFIVSVADPLVHPVF